MIDGTKIKEARTLLRWTQKQLAKAAGLRVETIERVERSASGELPLTIAHAAMIFAALERGGVEFASGTIRLKQPRPRADDWRKAG